VASLTAAPSATLKRSALVASILGSAVVFLDATVVNVALPSIRAGLHGDLADQQWVVEAYLLTLSSLLLIGGSLGDVLGRRRIFAVGVAAFGICSLFCALAVSTLMLTIGRAAQGVAGALLVPSSLALIADIYEDNAERGAAIGTWTAWTGIATVIGPLGGGFLIGVASWRWIFAINVVPVIATLWLLRSVPSGRRAVRRIDLVGALLASLGLAGPVFALIEQPRYGWGDPRVLVPLVGGLILIAAFIAWERRTAEPMLPLHLFAKRNFAVANVATFSLYGGLAVATFFLVLFLQQVGGYSPLQAGLALMPVTLMLFALSRRFGALAGRIGPRPLMGLGPVVAGCGLLLEMRISASADYLTEVLPGLLVFGLGMAATVAPLTSTVMGAAGQEHTGIASAVNNAVSRVAGLIAIAALGAAVTASFQSRLGGDLAGKPLQPASVQAVAHARNRPLVTSSGGAARADRAVVHAALVDSSVTAFRLAMGIGAAMAILGGLISLLGIESAPPQPTFESSDGRPVEPEDGSSGSVSSLKIARNSRSPPSAAT
jgi:EmrB/QacA subfamily drug resistance transporter